MSPGSPSVDRTDLVLERLSGAQGHRRRPGGRRIHALCSRVPCAGEPRRIGGGDTEARPPRDIPLGRISEPVAAEPIERGLRESRHLEDQACRPPVDLALNPILRIHYVGDVARITLNGRLLLDDFYNGKALELGLRRYAPEILGGELEIEILPLRKDALSPGNGQRIFAWRATPRARSSGRL